jgi:hypothetical protein
MPYFQQQVQKLVYFYVIKENGMTQIRWREGGARSLGTKNERTYNRVLSRVLRAKQCSLVHTSYVALLHVWSTEKTLCIDLVGMHYLNIILTPYLIFYIQTYFRLL